MNTNREVTACIFDLDGVIVDTAIHHFSAWKRMAKLLGIDIDEKFNEKLKGVSRRGSIEAILKYGGVTLSEDEINAYSDQKNNWYRSLISEMTPEDILPGVMPFLEDIKSRGLKICLGSASKNAHTVLRSVQLDSFFDAVVDGNDVKNSKPDPEVFLKGAGLLNAVPSGCIVFEDAEKGIDAALNAGMLAVGVGKPGTLLKAHLRIEGFEGLTFDNLLNSLSFANYD